MTTATNRTARIAGVEVATGHLIGGERVDSTQTFEVRSPIDGTFLADVSAGGAEEIDAAVRAAREAFPAWAALGPEGRHPILSRLAQLIKEHGAEIAEVETMDNGSLLAGNRAGMVPRSAHNFQFFADRALRINDKTIDSPEVENRVRYDPAGVAGLITPWNGPFMLSTWKVGPCLAAGDTAVLKPPEWAPLTCSLLADLAAEAGVPAGVLNIVQGIGEQAGAALAAHPGIDRISFTGSPETARLVGRSAADKLLPVSFELGGKSPMIVCADADLDAAAQMAAGAYRNAGQGCTFGTRVMADASIAEDFLARFRAVTEAMVVGDPRQPSTAVGPLIHPEHFRRVSGFVERALDAGARPLWGGARHEAGDLYFQPTLFDKVEQGMEILGSEVFGPVLTWQTYRDEEELVELANSTRYGLSATVYTRSEERAMRLAEQLVAGSVWVNNFMTRDLEAPFGGSRISGIGREGGEWSFDFFCDVKNIVIRKNSLDA